MIMHATTPGLVPEGSETPTSLPLLKRASTCAGLVPEGRETPTSPPNIKLGKVRALGVASLKRSPDLPALPTIAEQGVPGYETTIWLARDGGIKVD